MNQFAVVGSRLLVSLLDQAFPKAALLVAAIPKDSTVAPVVSQATSALDGVTAPLQGLVKVDVTGKEPQQIWLWGVLACPGGVGGHFKVGSDSRIRLSENRGAPNPGSHMSKKGYDDACDMRDLLILPGYQNRGHKSGWCWKCQSCELRSVTILAAMIPSGLGWLDQVSERGAESCMNGFFVSCGKGGWWHLKAEIRAFEAYWHRFASR